MESPDESSLAHVNRKWETGRIPMYVVRAEYGRAGHH